MGRAWHIRTMPKRSSKMPRDTNQLARMIVGMATGDIEPTAKADDGKNPAAVALGRLGGLKGGRARAMKLSDAERAEIARIAAQVRWKKSP